MRILKEWQARLHESFLLRQLKQNLFEREPVDFDLSQTIGILFNASLPQQREGAKQLAKQLKAKGKKTKLMAFLDEKEQQANFDFKHFSRKELDLLGRPKSTMVDDFINTPFDFLINLDAQEHLPLTYISARSKAQVRVGPYTNKTYCFDFMIETKKEDDLQQFINQLNYLLIRLNSRTHEKAIV